MLHSGKQLEMTDGRCAEFDIQSTDCTAGDFAICLLGIFNLALKEIKGLPHEKLLRKSLKFIYFIYQRNGYCLVFRSRLQDLITLIIRNRKNSRNAAPIAPMI